MMKVKNKKLLIGVAVMSCFAAGSSYGEYGANPYTQVGRYLTSQDGAKASQQNPLNETFLVTFPSSVRTVEDAMGYLLMNTGYRLLSGDHRSKQLVSMLNQRLPLSDRHFGTMTVKAGLLALAGETYQLLIDPAHRLVSFQLKPAYAKIYRNKPINEGGWS